MMKGRGYGEDIVTCHVFHVPCGPDSRAVARLGYFERSSSALVLLFCHSSGVCSSRVESSLGTDGLQNTLVILAHALNVVKWVTG